jgi:uncharacterized protein
MRFWDSSAVIPLLVGEKASGHRKAQLRSDPRMTVWWGCSIECASALDRLCRDGGLDETGLATALGRLEAFADAWYEVLPTNEVRERAIRLLRVHALRAADSIQLAAALIAASENPRALPFLTADDRLREAAVKEGFSVG